MDTLLGLLFALLWSSATIATRIIGKETAPLTILAMRFALAGALMFIYNYALKREALPKGRQWRDLAVLGFTNSTGFLGLSWIAIQQEPVGLYQLFIAAGPFAVALLSMVWLKRVIVGREWLGMALAAAGLAIVVAPNIGGQTAAPIAIALTIAAMLINSYGSVYARHAQLQLKSPVVNTWQLAFGLLFLLPITAATNAGRPINFNLTVALGLLWVSLMVSIGAMVIWFYLVRKDPVRASNWLLLTPLFSYLLGALLFGEAIRATDLVGGTLVMIGLVVSGTFTLGKKPAQS